MKDKMIQVGAFKMLPCRPDVCQQCAVKHEPDQPHNQQSLYYQYYFYANNGKFPTWNDAMAHCTDGIKQKWIAGLKTKGIEV